MTVRILVGENEDVRELSEEFPEEAAIIEEMLKDSEADAEETKEESKVANA